MKYSRKTIKWIALFPDLYFYVNTFEMTKPFGSSKAVTKALTKKHGSQSTMQNSGFQNDFNIIVSVLP